MNKPTQIANTTQIAFYAKEVLEREPLFTIDIERIQSLLPEVLMFSKEITSNFSYEITFLTLEEIQELNRTTRKIDSPTDVLSFEPVDEFAVKNLHTTVEIFLCPQYIANALSEALEAPNSDESNEELVRMMVHGILHVNGYKHEREFVYKHSEPQASTEIEPMYILQEKLVKALLH